MKIQLEQQKIKSIMEDGLFKYKDVTYSLDRKATEELPANASLSGRPLIKFVGNAPDGSVMTVWSHQVEYVPAPVAVAEIVVPKKKKKKS